MIVYCELATRLHSNRITLNQDNYPSLSENKELFNKLLPTCQLKQDNDI